MRSTKCLSSAPSNFLVYLQAICMHFFVVTRLLLFFYDTRSNFPFTTLVLLTNNLLFHKHPFVPLSNYEKE